MMKNIYEAPKSDLIQPTFDKYRSLEKGINGDYEIVISDILKEAWNKVYGVKSCFWMAILLIIVTQVLLGFFFSVIISLLGDSVTFIQQSVSWSISAPMGGGIYMIVVSHSVEKPYSPMKVFEYYPYVLSLLGINFLTDIFALFGLIVFIIPGIYLYFSYCLAVPLFLENDLGVWEAMETSRKAISNNKFKVIFLLIISGCIAFFGTILTVGIGLIWALPFHYMVQAILYKTIFGVKGEA